ncbi:MAG: hypothetical protein DMD87_03195 [Candidatus Rokuibacteriota bacterium]|nr:MAG: hypothetical protein DMD87_03195 [Candidatus Rokubacteria bacterium]
MELWSRPQTRNLRQGVDVLAELGVLPTEFARRFRGVAGFWNVLVHGYLRIDPARVHELLNAGLDDFAEFARHVDRFLPQR